MKIAIYTENLTGRAGIESVVREHLRIFTARGVSCLTFGEAGSDVCVPRSGSARYTQVKKALNDFRPDICIVHGVAHPGMTEDARVCRELKIPLVGVCHFSFPSAILLDGDEAANRNFYRGAKLCDAIVTVSAIDAQWWRAMGLRAFHVQNPFVHPKMNVERSLGRHAPRNALWVGRPAQQKQPSAALAAFADVTRAVPDAHLTMVGGDDKSWKPLRKLAKCLGIEKNVTFLAAQSDISDLWAEADFHLLSSVTESFCLVLAEAKAWGIPSVMFEIPFLELVQLDEGLLTAPQGDTKALAAQMVRLMTEEGLCVRLGEEAKASLAPFNDDAVWASWENVFEALKTAEGGYDVSPELKMTVSQITFAWDNFCDRNLWAVEFVRNWQLLTHISWNPIAKLIASLVARVRKIKAKIRNLR